MNNNTGSYSLDTLHRERDEIKRLANESAFLYLKDMGLVNRFIVEENEASEKHISDFKLGLISFSDAMSKLREQHNALLKSHMDLQMDRVKLFVIAERHREKNSLLTITLKRVGFVSGGLQIIGGGGICVASLGAACGSLGTPLLAHGIENMWENGYYLLYREDPESMPLRNAYRSAAAILGGDNSDGDIAYSVGDLSLSAASLFRSVLKPDSWKLFRYIKDDYIIGWKEMGGAGLISEMAGDSASGFSIYQLINGQSTNWRDISEEE